jgi:hypothetical protein
VPCAVNVLRKNTIYVRRVLMNFPTLQPPVYVVQHPYLITEFVDDVYNIRRLLIERLQFFTMRHQWIF